MKIVLIQSLGANPAYIQQKKEELKKQGHVFEAYDALSDAEVIEKAADADVLMLANRPLSEEVLENLHNLKLIDVAFTGVDHIPLKSALKRGIVVCNASGYATVSTAELAVGLMLAKLRDLDKAQTACREGKDKSGLRAFCLQGKTVGIIGAGEIGLHAAKLADAFGAKVVAYSRTKKDVQQVQEWMDLKDLLECSDIVSLHVPLTENTRNLIDANALKRMKKDAILINTARGPVVSTQDLIEALEQGEIAGAAIDVFDTEPPLDPDSAVLQAPNLTVTPHIGFYTAESMEKRAEIVFDNLESWLNGTVKNRITA